MWIYIIAIALCATFGRMGGAKGYDKLWRRLGCTFIISSMLLLHSNMSILQWAISSALIGWGCWSYFGWINYIVLFFWKYIMVEREYWWNFFAGALLIQSAILIGSFSAESLCTAFVFALSAAFGKVWIDNDEDGWKRILFWHVREDVLSELYFWGLMCLGMIVNVKF